MTMSSSPPALVAPAGWMQQQQQQQVQQSSFRGMQQDRYDVNVSQQLYMQQQQHHTQRYQVGMPLGYTPLFVPNQAMQVATPPSSPAQPVSKRPPYIMAN